MLRITAVKHDDKGEIVAYKLSDGKIVSKEEGVRLASEGQIEGVRVGTSKKGEKYLRSLPDGNDDNNLDNLPEFQ
ncbi:hypothetical protein ABG79_02410 [Caloramator mitchellensis]|uniref:DUF3892 domain-containing protein n=1 Tax=Caloramator mitchellensis TaxID=908809 RepID=A0A0R3JX95_CALMK|nr:DUF3892 domain-containing protein [Caloramator mitchellensis]KRQ85806.1 hypothetical protein ABG79_02410 [Caloramator mitchellensis]